VELEGSYHSYCSYCSYCIKWQPHC